MPFIQVTILEGRSEEQKRALLKGLTEATIEALGSKPESVRVVISEVDPMHWSVAGEPILEWRARNS